MTTTETAIGEATTITSQDLRPSRPQIDPRPAKHDGNVIAEQEEITPTVASMTNLGRRKSALYSNAALVGIMLTAGGLASGNIPFAIGAGMMTIGSLRMAAVKR